jgi:hypothetical protein
VLIFAALLHLSLAINTEKDQIDSSYDSNIKKIRVTRKHKQAPDSTNRLTKSISCNKIVTGEHKGTRINTRVCIKRVLSLQKNCIFII